MARKRREWLPGDTLHITSRGNRKEVLFYDDKDRHYYLALLSKAKNKYPFQLHSYCLMRNHIHLLIETTHTPPGKIIHSAHASYARYFNNRYDLVGHVFQGRFVSKKIKDAAHFLYVSRYIHRNPFEANIVNDPRDYNWSSYPAYVNDKEDPLITKDKILQFFPTNPINNYRHYVEARLDY
ncbi:transposase [Lederbergia panacisoli]|uniref:transposase n=1 Tax=Lederbergia panacisoli TaxID=1255251 RepID=UPI00214C3BA8|nr:transposase [Lederbergia panacisoli]MCR2822347.1 transposase [Lederbergia panacisoli]